MLPAAKGAPRKASAYKARGKVVRHLSLEPALSAKVSLALRSNFPPFQHTLTGDGGLAAEIAGGARW